MRKLMYNKYIHLLYIMENNKAEFKRYLKFLVSKLHETKPTNNTEKIIKVFDKLNIEKVSNRYFNIINPYYSLLDQRKEELFNNQLNIMPKVNLSDYRELLNDESKDKLWSLLNVLYVLSDLIKNSEVESQSPNNQVCEVDTKQSAEFNPYIGVQPNNNNYTIDQMFGGPKDLPGEKKNIDLSSAGLMSQVGQLSKMIDMNKFSEDIKNINSDDIKEATNNIKNMLGSKSDEKTSNLISDMLDDITKELQNNNLTDGDPFQNIMKVAEKVAERIKPKVEENNIDLTQFMSSNENNPMNLLTKMMGDMNNEINKTE
jgi:hypothetical protein